MKTIEMAQDSSNKDLMDQLKKALSTDDQFENLVKKFSECKKDEDRVRLLYDNSAVQDILKVQVVERPKNAEKSVILRDEGNKMFQQKNKTKALEIYNASVRKAPTTGDTSALTLALANRSAVLFHMKHYQLCINDVEMAFKFGYPEKTRYKLWERVGKCYLTLCIKAEAKKAFEEAKSFLSKSALQQDKVNNLINEFDQQIWQCDKLPSSTGAKTVDNVKFHDDIPNLGSKANTAVPAMSDGLALFMSEEAGRGLIALREISAGELLVVEKPFSSTLLPDFTINHCHHCCNRILSAVACLQCSEVVFCSEDCRVTSWDSYHKHECTILATVRNKDISLGHLALKMVLRSGAEYLEEFENLPYITEGGQVMEGFNQDGKYDSNDYRSVYSLVNHTENRQPEDVMKYALEALFLLKCLETTDFFGSAKDEGLKSSPKKFSVGGHILRQLQMLPCNAHECSELAVRYSNLPESITMEVGSAIYPVLSLINHSCDPNVVRHSYGDVCVVRAIRNIEKGTEILDNYGALYALSTCEQRRNKLSPQYFFTCKCEACEDDYPLYVDTPSDVPVFKCDKCRGPVFLPLEDRFVTQSCASCKTTHELSPRVQVLAKSDETYRRAMYSVLTEANTIVDKHIPTLESHLQLMNRLLARPWRDYNDCQEALKQCYALKASHFKV